MKTRTTTDGALEDFYADSCSVSELMVTANAEGRDRDSDITNALLTEIVSQLAFLNHHLENRDLT